MGIFDCFLYDTDNYDDRKVGRIEKKDNNGIGVSTAYTSDEGYETALIDKNEIHPVERYSDVDKAKIGHEKWVEFAKTANGKTIKSLGWSEMHMDKYIILVAE